MWKSLFNGLFWCLTLFAKESHRRRGEHRGIKTPVWLTVESGDSQTPNEAERERSRRGLRPNSLMRIDGEQGELARRIIHGNPLT